MSFGQGKFNLYEMWKVPVLDTTIQHYVIKLVSDLRQVGHVLLTLRFPPLNKTDRHDITEILLKVVLNTITLTQYPGMS
jgi:hypothetical protein